jgi:hypothetical protein
MVTNQIQFKQIETRLLGPMSLLVQSNTDDGAPAKGIDLILPAFTWALEVRLYLPVPESQMNGKATEGYRRVDQDVEMNIFSPPAMRLSLRFPEAFYEKYSELIENKSNFKVMAYVLGYIDQQVIAPQGSLEEGAQPADEQRQEQQLEEANS